MPNLGWKQKKAGPFLVWRIGSIILLAYRFSYKYDGSMILKCTSGTYSCFYRSILCEILAEGKIGWPRFTVWESAHLIILADRESDKDDCSVLSKLTFKNNFRLLLQFVTVKLGRTSFNSTQRKSNKKAVWQRNSPICSNSWKRNHRPRRTKKRQNKILKQLSRSVKGTISSQSGQTFNRAWNRCPSFKWAQWLKIIPHKYGVAA